MAKTTKPTKPQEVAAKDGAQGQAENANAPAFVQFGRVQKVEGIYGGNLVVIEAGVRYKVVDNPKFDVDHNSRTISAQFLAGLDADTYTTI